VIVNARKNKKYGTKPMESKLKNKDFIGEYFMIGEKELNTKAFYKFSLAEAVPEDDYYRRLDRVLDLSFLRKECKGLYGTTGNQSIDPVVFFKILIVGYLENIIYDRQLAKRIKDSLSIRLFLRYDIDESTPWHSTISRTRALIPIEIYKEAFLYMLRVCIEHNLVAGDHISIDSSLVKANASLDSLEQKTPHYSLTEYIEKTTKENETGEKPKKKQRTNETHISKKDADSRIAKKPGKPVDLYYKNNISTDPKKGIIIHTEATHAHINDSLSLIDVVEESKKKLEENNLQLRSLSADKQYCKGKRLKELEELNIEAYIPLVKQRRKKGVWGIEKFVYDKENDCYTCPNGKKLPYKDNNGKSKKYRASYKDCKICPFKQKCITKGIGRLLFRPVYKEQFDNLKKRLKTPMAKRATRYRKVVERAFGELKNNLSMKKVNTIGIENAQKKFIMAAFTYNLKKFVKYGYKYASSPAINKGVLSNNNLELKLNFNALLMSNYMCYALNNLNYD